MRDKPTGKSTGPMSGTNVWKYQDMLHLPHPVSRTHPPMDRMNRAAQFAPFAALTGHGAASEETRRQTDPFRQLEEYEQGLLDEKLQWLYQHMAERPSVTITQFVPDEKKEGGAYVQITGTVRKIDEYNRLLVMTDGQKIPLDRIFDIKP